MTLIVDTGAIVALLDRSDHHHLWALECFRSLKPPIITCEAVFAEAWHLLGEAPPARMGLAKLHQEKLIQCDFSMELQADAVWNLLKKYADTPMDFADACLVRMAEIFPQSKIWTVDSDFKIYKKAGRHVIPTLAPWN